MLHRPDFLKTLRPESDKALDTVPELPNREYPNDFSEYDAILVQTNLDALNFVMNHKFDLLSLQRYKKEASQVIAQWNGRWKKEYASWENVAKKVLAEQEKAAQATEKETGYRKTIRGTVSPFTLFLYGDEVLDYDLPEVASSIPQTSDQDKKELAHFLITLADLVSLFGREFQLAYLSSILYSQSFSQQGLSEKRAQLLTQWAGHESVRSHLIPDDEDTDFYKAVHEKSLKRPVKLLPGKLPRQLSPSIMTDLRTSAHAFVSAKLFGANEEILAEVMEGILADEEPVSFVAHKSGSTSQLGYKLHVRGDYRDGENTYAVIPLVYEYCSRNGLSFKMRVYNGQEQMRGNRSFDKSSRWGPTFITIYPETAPKLEDDLEVGFGKQLDEMLMHAKNLESLLARTPNTIIQPAVSDIDLHLGNDKSHRLSIRFGENIDSSKIGDWLKRLQWKVSEERDVSFEECFPQALSLETALKKIRGAKQR